MDGTPGIATLQRSLWTPSLKVLLISDRVGLGHPTTEFFRDVLRPDQTEGVEVISRRKGLNLLEHLRIDAPRKDEMAVNPSGLGRQLRKGHAHLERDSRPFWEHGHRSVLQQSHEELIKNRADDRRLPCEMRLELMPPTRM